MSDRDELADALMRADPHYPAVMARHLYENMADAILARWRLVPVEPTGPCGAINLDTGDVCALTVGHARHHLSAAQREERQQRAASELTRHDTNAGHHGITPPVPVRKPVFDPTDPAMISAVKEYFEHGFDNETIIRTSFPGLTPEIIDALRTDQHGPHE